MISACMIVQDEEECLKRALDSIYDYVDEIIIIDGGSVDKTREIAVSYDKVKLFDIPFPKNFATQKNNAIEKASGDWILFLDADEYYDSYTMAALSGLVTIEEYDAYAFSRKTFIDGRLLNLFDQDYQTRFFRSHCRYEANEIGISEKIVGYTNLQSCNLDIKHYKKEQWQQKDNELYWDMGHQPPAGWSKIDGKWTYTQSLDDIQSFEGWMSEPELKWLHDTAKKVPAGELIVEIGAWMGRSSAAIYLGASGKNPVITIDTWQGSPDEPEHNIAQTEDIFAKYCENIKSVGITLAEFESFPLENKCYYLVGDSLEAVERFLDKSVAWLFYDGRHTTTGENLDAWMPKMKDDGLLTGHDYFCFYEHIQQEIHKRFWIHEIHNSIWVKYMKNERLW